MLVHQQEQQPGRNTAVKMAFDNVGKCTLLLALRLHVHQGKETTTCTC